MSLTESADVAALRLEVRELKLRIDGIEVRIAAAERKQMLDHQALTEKWGDVVIAVNANSKAVSNLASQQMASHYSLVHLLAVTARQMKVPDADLNEAMRMATEAMKTPTEQR